MNFGICLRKGSFGATRSRLFMFFGQEDYTVFYAEEWIMKFYDMKRGSQDNIRKRMYPT